MPAAPGDGGRDDFYDASQPQQCGANGPGDAAGRASDLPGGSSYGGIGVMSPCSSPEVGSPDAASPTVSPVPPRMSAEAAKHRAQEADLVAERRVVERIEELMVRGDAVHARLSPVPPPSTDAWTPGVDLRVLCVTWNMEGSAGPRPGASGGNLSDIVPREGGDYHVIAVGTQEALRSIPKSFFNSSKADWERLLSQHLGANYAVVGQETMMATHVIVFARNDVMAHIDRKCVACAQLSTGLGGGAVGNKGAVGVGFTIASGAAALSLLFLCAHFQAHQAQVEARNTDYTNIVGGIRLGRECADPAAAPHALPEPHQITRVAGPSTLPLRDVTDEYDLVWFLGDFNYRVDGSRRMADVCVERNEWAVLQSNDQLRGQMRKGRCFPGFREGPISFPPTYKYAKDKQSGLSLDTYETKKMRIPSWTDRILFKQHPNMLSRALPHDAGGERDLQLRICDYRAVDSVRLSDHRPVCADFVVFTPSSAGAAPPPPPAANPTSRACCVQ
eukprot:TRINITY_DN5477_c0_g1_i2.p1 TRINITY_DN5477_c0_g1~~TRINITY_DN5477_c0_g1_i2.p1  ORF type:complete len:535 (+),score=151.40 TRINITY_DN5477_c0_g1_i2:98-1606(+)